LLERLLERLLKWLLERLPEPDLFGFGDFSGGW
jgi:hypothetical protein